MINLLVTGAGGGVGQGIIKSLKLIKDLDFKIITADMSSLASGLYGGDYSHLVPAASAENYFDEISKICVQHNIDYYFPGTDVELLICAKSVTDIKEKLGVNIIVSPINVIEVADDKLKTVEFLKVNGFSYPQSWIPSDVDLESLGYPMIVKPRVGCRSIGVHIVHTSNEAKSAIDSLIDPILQEYIDGDEYTCTVAVSKGVVSDVLCFKRDLRAGDTFRAFPVKSNVIEEYVRNIAIKLKVNGSCNFQLRLENGVPKLFEINSRFSGTTPFCTYLGFNPVEFCLKHELGLPYKSNIDYNKVIVRHWCEVVLDRSQLDALNEKKQGAITSVVVSKIL
ncbi:MAG: ATP-grasp domain-containing protein [Colwellia sp.]